MAVLVGPLLDDLALALGLVDSLRASFQATHSANPSRMRDPLIVRAVLVPATRGPARAQERRKRELSVRWERIRIVAFPFRVPLVETAKTLRRALHAPAQPGGRLDDQLRCLLEA